MRRGVIASNARCQSNSGGRLLSSSRSSSFLSGPRNGADASCAVAAICAANTCSPYGDSGAKPSRRCTVPYYDCHENGVSAPLPCQRDGALDGPTPAASSMTKSRTINRHMQQQVAEQFVVVAFGALSANTVGFAVRLCADSVVLLSIFAV